MTDTAAPLDDTLGGDFLAARGAAARGGDQWIKELAGQQGGVRAPAEPSPAAAAPSASGAAAGPDQPLGLAVEQGMAANAGTAPSRASFSSGPNEGLDQQALFEKRATLEKGTPEYDDLTRQIAKAQTQTVENAAGYAAPAGKGIAGVVRAAGEGLLGKAAMLAKPAAEAVAGATATEGAATEAATAAAAKPALEAPPPLTLAADPGADLKVTPELREQAADYLSGKSGDNPIQASLEGLANSETMNASIARVASFIPKDSVKPDEVLRMGAYSLNKTPEEILEGFRGALPKDEEIGAWAMLINSGAEQLAAASRRAVESGDPQDWEQAVRAFTLQNKVIGDWREAGTEMGRAFRARQLAWDARGDYSRAIKDIIEGAGPDNVEAAVRKIASLQTPEQANGFLSALRWMKSRDGLLYGWYNYLLGPKTVVKKAATDMVMPLYNLATRYAAEKFGASAGTAAGVAPGETAALLAGYTGAFGDAVRAAGRGLIAGRSQFAAEYQSMDGLAGTRLSLLANGAPEMMGADKPTYSALAYLRTLLPTSWVAGLDDGAKVFNYRAELTALAHRQGVKQGLEGGDLGAFVNDAVTNVPPAMHEQAVTAALQTTFQEPLSGVAQSLSDAADKFNIPLPGTSFEIPAGRILVPFAKIPANFVRFMYRNSPLPLAFPTAAFKAETAFPGAARDLAYAKVGLGSALSVTSAGLAMAGYITGRGPSDPQMNAAWRRAGNQPYSVQFPGQAPVTYPIEPFGMTIGAVADTVDLMKFARPEDSDQLAVSVGLGIGRAFLSRTYMSGLADFLDAVQHPDRSGARWIDQLVASLTVPRIGADWAGAQDPWMRAHYDAMGAIESKLPFVSSGLPFARTLWGEKIPLSDAYLPPFSGTGAAHMLSPVIRGPDPATAEPIDTWIWENRAAFPQGDQGRLGLTKPGLVQSYEQGPHVATPVQLDPYQLDRLQELAGNALKDPRTGLGAKDSLNAMISGAHPNAATQREWDTATPAGQALMVLKTVNQYRGAAKKQLMTEYPDIAEAAQAGWAQRRQALTPAGAGTGAAIRAPSIGGGP